MSCTQGPAGGTTTVVARTIYNLSSVTTATPFVIADHIDVSMYREVTLVARTHAVNIGKASTLTLLVFGNSYTLQDPEAATITSALASVLINELGTPTVYLLNVPSPGRLLHIRLFPSVSTPPCNVTLSIDLVGKGGIGSLTGDGYATMEGYRSFG